MSTKQLARTVIDGRAITFLVGDMKITGFLAGMDDYHWLVLQSGQDGITKSLIHKGSASVITLATEPSYEVDPWHDAMECIIRPFRDHLVEGGLVRAPRRAVSSVA